MTLTLDKDGEQLGGALQPPRAGNLPWSGPPAPLREQEREAVTRD